MITIMHYIDPNLGTDQAVDYTPFKIIIDCEMVLSYYIDH